MPRDRVPRDQAPKRPSAKETECLKILSAKWDSVQRETECQQILSAKIECVPRETELQERLSVQMDDGRVREFTRNKFALNYYLYRFPL